MNQITSTTYNSWLFFENLDCTRNGDNLDELVKPAQKLSAIMDLWWQRKSLHPALEVKINSVMADYFGAIQSSAHSAQQGCSFASEAITFCNRLIDGKGPIEVLDTSLQDMIVVSESAYESFKAMNEQFKQVRAELLQISKDSSSEVTTIASEHAQTMMVEGLHRLSGNIHTLHGGKTAGSTEHIGEMTASQNELEAILQQLRTTEDLNMLLQHVSHFIDWWSDITTSLVSLKAFLPKSEADGSNQLWTGSIKERWTDMFLQYDSYGKRINEFQDYYNNIGGDSALHSTATVLKKLIIDQRSAAKSKSAKEGTAEELLNAAARAAERRLAEEKQKADSGQQMSTTPQKKIFVEEYDAQNASEGKGISEVKGQDEAREGAVKDNQRDEGNCIIEKTEKGASQKRDADEIEATIRSEANEAKRYDPEERQADKKRNLEVKIWRDAEGNSLDDVAKYGLVEGALKTVIEARTVMLEQKKADVNVGRREGETKKDIEENAGRCAAERLEGESKQNTIEGPKSNVRAEEAEAMATEAAQGGAHTKATQRSAEEGQYQTGGAAAGASKPEWENVRERRRVEAEKIEAARRLAIEKGQVSEGRHTEPDGREWRRHEDQVTGRQIKQMGVDDSKTSTDQHGKCCCIIM